MEIELPTSEPHETDEEATTVAQPNIPVVCDPDKLDDRGSEGGRDLIVEIISTSTVARDQIKTVALYERMFFSVHLRNFVLKWI